MYPWLNSIFNLLYCVCDSALPQVLLMYRDIRTLFVLGITTDIVGVTVLFSRAHALRAPASLNASLGARRMGRLTRSYHTCPLYKAWFDRGRLHSISLERTQQQDRSRHARGGAVSIRLGTGDPPQQRPHQCPHRRGAAARTSHLRFEICEGRAAPRSYPK